MATVVWHGLQYSCSDQHTAELPHPPPVTSLRLKLAPQKPAHHHGGWTFLHSLSVNSDVTLREDEKDGFAPLAPSLLKLSEKSLEMCTENLGSETGSDVISDGDTTDIYPSFMSSSPTIGKTRQQPLGVRKVNSAVRGGFPPPLTTMRGGERVVVRSHREEGRLVMDAVKCPSSRSNFITDRSHGRLRLSLLRPVDDSDEVGTQLIKTDTTATNTVVSNENEFREGNHEESGEISLINIRDDDHERENVSESTSGRVQKQVPAISRCMEGDEHELLYHHHRHYTRELINVRFWVATS